METNLTEAQAVAQLAQKPFMQDIGGVQHIVYPASNGAWSFKSFPEYLAVPLRKTGSVTIHDVDSFIEVAKKQGIKGSTNIYLDVNYVTQKINATAVFNDHSDGEAAGHKDYKALFTPRIGAEWARWNAANGKKMDQEDFANFLQDNIGDISNQKDSKLPSGGDVLTFVSNLQEKRLVTYGRAINTQNGMVQIEFTEEGDKATKGNIEVFKEFGLALRPFFGGAAYSINALLRYRIDRNGGDIVFWFELQRPDRILEDASTELIKKLAEGTGYPVIYGVAP